MLSRPYTSTTTEAVPVGQIRSVVVTRMVSAHARSLEEAVMTIGWGAVSRVDLEPAACDDPNCDADHGYTGSLTGDDFSLRLSTTADGGAAVTQLLDFGRDHQLHRHRSRLMPAGVRDFGPRGRAQLDQLLPSVAAALGLAEFDDTLGLPAADRYVVMVLDGLGLQLLDEHADAAPFLASL